jgi:hypothetical protein
MRVSPATVSCGKSAAPGSHDPSRPRYPRPRSWYPPHTASSEVGCDHRLLPVLASAHVHEVVRRRIETVADGERVDAQLVTARRQAPLEDGDVAAVGVDVEVLGVEVADADDHFRPSLSQ